MTARKQAAEEFVRRFGAEPRHLVRAPGRVNLIGEHTDYNNGFVLPIAIDQAIWIALSPRTDRRVRVTSLNIGETATIELDDLQRGKKGWIEYLKGMAWVLSEADYGLQGWDGVLAGDIPIGAGLSSSAAFELAVAIGFWAVAPWDWDGKKIAQLARKADREWLGIQSGIMDQLISALGQADNALLIDCLTLETRQVHVPSEASVVVMDTGTRRELVSSAYNERVAECARAAAFFRLESLREVTGAMLAEAVGELEPVIYSRARHVVSENTRVLEAERVMAANDADALGVLMNASHASLQQDYEVSSPELDTMVEIARAQKGCFGARMTGAGFGGSAVALVEDIHTKSFVRHVSRDYERATGLAPQLFVCTASDGASVLY